MATINVVNTPEGFSFAPPAYEGNKNNGSIVNKTNYYEQSRSHASHNSHRPSGTTIRFPPKFICHIKLFSTVSYIGASKETPRFAVQAPSRLVNCFGLGHITLRDGLDKNSPPIATVGVEPGSFFRRSLIRVGNLEISMSGDWGRTHEFTLPLGNGVVERFEWRHSRGDEVRELSGGFNYGWKLVRLDGPVVVPGQQDWFKSYTSDGKEVVAVGAHPRFLNKSPEFGFVGTGARGELGETFEIVAVMGFLRLYELSVQQSTANSTAAASAGIA